MKLKPRKIEVREKVRERERETLNLRLLPSYLLPFFGIVSFKVIIVRKEKIKKSGASVLYSSLKTI
jgi:hypothetical protein